MSNTGILVRTFTLCVVGLCQLFVTPSHASHNWPQFRGIQASGVAEGNPPTVWNVETGDNVRWIAAIPGLGHSSPIVWDKRVFLTTAVNSETDDPTLETGWLGGSGKAAEDEGDWAWQVLCLDRVDGKILWTKTVATGLPKLRRHLKATHANCTPATNGKFVVAFFGSEGLYCLDFNGNIIWRTDFGKLHSGPYDVPELEWGFASSPVIHNNQVIVQCDCLNQAFVAVLDLETGEELRRIERDENATWSTPTLFQFEDQTQLVCNGYKQMAGYNFDNGELLWSLSGGGDVPVPTPLFADGRIVITNGHARSPTFVISPSARGDLTPASETADNPAGLLWWQPRGGSYMPTPIIVGDLLYTCSDNGRMTVQRMDSGEQVYQKRVAAATFSASAVATPSRIYLASEEGQVFVVKTGEEFEMLATNTMNEITMASPALSGDQLFIRTLKQLVCLANDDDQ